EVLEMARLVGGLPGLALEGLFTHFATADWSDQTYVLQQLQVFEDVLRGLREVGITIPVVHAANSGAIQMLPGARFNAVRPGIILYGLQASSQWASPFPLRPALSLKSRVSRVRVLPAGAGVSYGRTYVTSRPTRAALVPVGYGDGYHRALSNQGAVLVRGRRAPILGRVCMDQFVVDASAIPDAAQDDEVVIIGKQGEEQISAEEIAGLTGTINYEVTTALLPRVTRVYLQGGQVVGRSGLGEERGEPA
ncbi:MAG TPA: alanine racemase, partial [Anaerolineaceae bacterium]